MLRSRFLDVGCCRRRGERTWASLHHATGVGHFDPEHQGHRGALADLARHADFPSHQPRQAPGNGQPEPGPADPGGRAHFGLLEGLEQARLSLRRNPDARVLDFETQGFVLAFAIHQADAQLDMALLGELDRVADEIAQDLPEAKPVHHHRRADLGVDMVAQLKALAARTARVRSLDGGSQLDEGNRLGADFELACLHLREVEDVVDDPLQRMAGLLDGIQRRAQFRVQRRQVDQLEDAEHAVQRRADFVAHRRQELSLGEVRVVRDFLRQVKTLLECLADGDILDRAVHPRHDASGVHVGHHDDLHRQRVAFQEPCGHFIGLPLAGFLRLEERFRSRPRAVLEQGDPFRQVGGTRSRIAPEHVVDLRRPADDAGREVARPVAETGHGMRIAEPSRCFPQRLFDLLDRGDVRPVTIPDHVAIRPTRRGPGGTNPTQRPIGPADTEIHFHFGKLHRGSHHSVLQLGPVLGDHHRVHRVRDAEDLLAIDADDLPRVRAEEIEADHALRRSAQHEDRARQALGDRPQATFGTQPSARLAEQPPQHRQHERDDDQSRKDQQALHRGLALRILVLAHSQQACFFRRQFADGRVDPRRGALNHSLGKQGICAHSASVGVDALRRDHQLDAFLDQPAQPSAPIPLHRVVGNLVLQRHPFLPKLLERVLARAVELRVSGKPKTTMARLR